jgi:enhancing lycopene biosynthesis protein 2
MKRFAVVLSGCGHRDGAEIHESVLTLLAIARNGASYEAFAPDIPQRHVFDHYAQKSVDEPRNVLVESARIARGAIRPLPEYDPGDFDALVFPGGFGAALNLSSFGVDGSGMTVEPSVERAVSATHRAGKPIGMLCVSPAILAKLIPGAKLTMGSDPGAIAGVEAMGARHVVTTHGEVAIDEERRLFSTPCYMLDATIVQIAEGAENLVRAMLARM